MNRVTPARCFRCRLKLGRERFTIRFPSRDFGDGFGNEGEVLLCGRCFDHFKSFLKGPPV